MLRHERIDMGKERIKHYIEMHRQELEAMALDIWRHPEGGFKEVRTSALQADYLKKLGAAVSFPVSCAPTAFVAEYGVGKPVIGFLGELDALPGFSQKVIAVKEPVEEGAYGHACGHNLLCCGSLAGFAALMEVMREEHLRGTIRYYGCPAEESFGGKTFMAREGLFDDLDCCMNWHPSGDDAVALTQSSAFELLEFYFTGTEAHAGANPHLGRSALDAVELMNVGANYLREHVISAARIQYIITDGGQAVNIVPGKAAVRYAVRAPQIEQLQEIVSRLVDISKGAALMTGTEVVHQVKSIYHNRLPNYALSGLVYDNLKECPWPEYTQEELELFNSLAETYPEGTLKQVCEFHGVSMEEIRNSMLFKPLWRGSKSITVGGSTDVGDVSWITPTVNLTVTCCPVMVNGHSWQACAAYGSTAAAKGMTRAGQVMASSAYDLLTDRKDVIEAAKRELEEDKGGRSYTPIPADMVPSYDD
ncbi:amidohydrolase [Clostridium sp. MCC353]|uniref:amidohydrolase n=1 Tax=Clostridium sp. MCC353 TaxID=2592646 RepID=UPI001C028202|nr:amidohydrolase [Clostridium sp. MCC353]